MDPSHRSPCVREVQRHCPEPVGYRVRSDARVWGMLWPDPDASEVDVAHRCIAITIAAKSRTEPGSAIQVIHLETGQVVYQKPTEPAPGTPLPA